MILKVISNLGGKVKVVDPAEQKLSPAARKMKKTLNRHSKKLSFIRKGKYG